MNTMELATYLQSPLCYKETCSFIIDSILFAYHVYTTHTTYKKVLMKGVVIYSCLGDISKYEEIGFCQSYFSSR